MRVCVLLLWLLFVLMSPSCCIERGGVHGRSSGCGADGDGDGNGDSGGDGGGDGSDGGGLVLDLFPSPFCRARTTA